MPLGDPDRAEGALAAGTSTPRPARPRRSVNDVQARAAARGLRCVQANPDVDVRLAWTGPEEPIRLLVLRTLPARRGLGLGGAALRDVVAMANALGAVVRLTVEPITGDDDTDLDRLVGWYAAHGFVLVCEAGGQPVMERPPSALGRA